MPQVTKPILLDETGKAIVSALKDISAAVLLNNADGINDALIIKTLLQTMPPYDAWKVYANARAAAGLTLNAIAERWFANLDDGKMYTTKIMRNDMSGGNDGLSRTTGKNTNKLDDNASLACLPSTASTEAVDDYAAIPGFMWLDCQYKIDGTTLEPELIAIEGVGDGVDYKPADSSLIGVIMPTYYRKEIQDESYRQLSIAFGARGGFEPLFAAKKAEGGTRPYYIFAKWMLGYNDNRSKLYNGYGAQPASYKGGASGSRYNYNISHNDVNSYMKTNYGTQYGGFCYGLYVIWAIDMMMIKYGVLGNSAVMPGCVSYSMGSKAAVAETGVKRVILTASAAADYIVGSRVSAGTETNRSAATCYNVCDISTITKKETVDGGNVAIYLDCAEAFDVTTDTYLTTQIYTNGYSEKVIGKHDGTPTDNTSGKEPFRLQGVEFGLGLYDIPGDTKLYYNAGILQYYAVNKCADRNGTGDINNLGQYKKVAEFDNSAATGDGWLPGVAEINRNSVSGAMSAKNCTNTQRYRCQQYHCGQSTSNAWRELPAFGHLARGGHAGLLCVAGGAGLGYGYWDGGSRPCGTAGNRG